MTTAAEIRELWGEGAAESMAVRGPGPDRDPDQSRVLDAMSSRAARAVLEISRRSGLAPERLGALLGLLELDGLVRRVDGGWLKVQGGRRRG